LRCYQRDISRFVHAQMQDHYWEDAVAYKVVVSKGFTEAAQNGAPMLRIMPKVMAPSPGAIC